CAALCACNSTMNALPIQLTYKNNLSEQLSAERLYYKSTILSKIDKFVAIALVAFGIFMVSLVGLRWWALIWFPLALGEWFNLLSPRPLQIIYWFRNNPKFRETYHLAFDRGGLHFRTDTIESRLKWDYFTRLLENRQLCLLVYGRRMYSVIPKR